MSAIEELQTKIDTYLDTQNEDIQNAFDAIETIKDQIETKVYLAKKLLDIELEIDDEEYKYKYFSKSNCELQVDSNLKMFYRDKPFFFINKNSFDISAFKDEENIFLTHFTVALNQKWDEINDDDNFWFFIPNCEVHEDNLKDFFQFILLTNGYTFHKPIKTSENQFINPSIKSILDCTKNFNQYQESAYILSEYNYTKDILLKYLLLYHIIENFMYRRPIAEMANSQLTIRDFKNLYKKVNDSEEQTLKELLKKIKHEHIINTTSIEDYFANNLRIYKESLTNTTNINSVFTSMGLQHIEGINYHNASKLIYIFRNSIIHNKETEFHITHTTLNSFNDLVKFFEEFLLPTLENIIYYLIFENNSIIDYPKNYLLLYGEHCET